MAARMIDEVPPNKADILRNAVRRGLLPSRLKRFMSFTAHTQPIFELNTLWASTVLGFNDPFDGQIIDAGNYTDSEVRAYHSRPHLNPSLADAVVARHQREPEFVQNLIEESKNNTLRTTGIISYAESKDEDDLLLWAHYAQKHAGFLLIFSTIEDVSFFHWLKKVKYEPSYPITRFLVETDMVDKQLLTKSTHWAYEQEWRSIKNHSGSFQYSPKCLSEVVFGLSMPKEHRIAIAYWIKSHGGMDHVKLKEARKKSLAYGLDYLPYVPKS
jgi:hypothetical protein